MGRHASLHGPSLASRSASACQTVGRVRSTGCIVGSSHLGRRVAQDQVLRALVVLAGPEVFPGSVGLSVLAGHIACDGGGGAVSQSCKLSPLVPLSVFFSGLLIPMLRVAVSSALARTGLAAGRATRPLSIGLSTDSMGRV